MPADPQITGATPRSARGNFFPPGLAVRKVRPIDNESVRQLFIESQNSLFKPDLTRDVRIALKGYIDSCLMGDLKRPSRYYTQAGKRLWLVESQERKIVAMVAVDTAEGEPGTAILRRLCVSEEFRRKGLGRLLTQRAEQWATKQGFEHSMLYVSELQPEAIQMYEQLEYARTDSEKVGPIQVWVLKKPLQDPVA